MFHSGLFGQAIPGGRPYDLGLGANFVNNAGGTVFTAGNFTTATGKVVVRLTCRINATTLTSLVVTYGGVALTPRVWKYGQTVQAIGDELVWIGTLTGIAVGVSKSLVVTTDKNTNRTVMRISDVDAAWSGGVGASAAAVGASAGTTISAAVAATGSTRLWAGCAAGLFNQVNPIGVNSPPWDAAVAEAVAGSGLDTSNDCTFVKGTGPTAGATMTLTGTMAASCNNRAAAIMEFI